ncbi:MAG: PQQ-binding-like beta-propeller repeat protein [Deltaproteobacteria bacterium]|nr:PQQ-binding-like beta-propeller repeat protein [Deltaproteobacteria bacterium]
MKKGIFSFIFASTFSLQIASAAEYQIFGRWLQEISRTENALTRFQRVDLAGLVIEGKDFFIASPDGTLQKRDLSAGFIRWETRLDGPSQSSWTFYNGTLYGGDTRGNIYALNATNGKIKWRTTTKGVFFSKPLVKGEQLWVMNSLGSLQSYEAETGRFLWQQNDPANITTSLWSFQGPVFFQNLVLAGFPSAILQAFDPINGKAIWNESFQAGTASSDSFNDLKAITVSDADLFASSFNGNLRVWQSTSGSKKLLWEKKISLHTPLTIGENGMIFLSARDGTIQALDSKTGFVKWQYQLLRGLGTQVALSKSNLWVGSSAGEVFVFSLDGKLISKTNDYQAAIWNAPVLLNDNEALVISSKANLRRLSLVKTKS